jgi:hypothetical protein
MERGTYSHGNIAIARSEVIATCNIFCIFVFTLLLREVYGVDMPPSHGVSHFWA